MQPNAGLDRASWDRIVAIFDRALDVGDVERRALLDQLCGSDATIRREVEEMLTAHDQGGLAAERHLATGTNSGDATPGGDGALPNATLPEGARVGAYRVVRPVGAGGMGDVYQAERADGAYRQTVALKVLRPGYRTAEMVRRFRVEREALARLVHPGIAGILDAGALADGRPYLVLEFVDGTPLTAYCAAHALSLRERLALFLRVAATVQFAHGRLVVHRDLKPSNILVQPDGAPRLLDFGIAKLLDPDAGASLAVVTAPEVRLLTPEYAAPEQLRGEPPGTATDVYTLGVLLFELLTGATPFPAADRSVAVLERAVRNTPAPTPSVVAASHGAAAPVAARRLRGDLDRVVLMALRKEPERRYASAAQFGEDVERYLAGRPVAARPDSVRYRAAKFVRRNLALVGAGAGLALLLAGFGAAATVQARRVTRERDRAERERTEAEAVLGILTGLFERGDPTKHPGGDTLRVASLLADAEHEVDRLRDDPVRQAALWRAVGRMRAARGEYAHAAMLLRRSVDRRRALFGPIDVEAARTRHELAVALASYKGEAAVRPLLDSSLRELRALLGDEHEDVRAATSDLLGATSDSVEARALLGRLMTLERRAPSRDPVAAADRLDAQGSARFNMGRYAEAADLFGASLELLSKRLPPESDPARTVRRNLALAYAGSGQLARAESLQRAEVALEDRMRGPKATGAIAREALALTFAREGRPDSAEAYERAALGMFRAQMAPNHWRIWSAQRNLAFIAAARDRVALALALLDSAVAGAATGPDSATAVGYLLAQRVPFLLRLGRTTDAAQSVARGERRLGASAAVTAGHRADVHRYVAMVALAAGDAGLAVARLRSAVALSEPPAVPDAAPGLHSCLLGVALVTAGRVGEAQPLLGVPCAAYEAQGLADPLIVRWIAAARVRARGARAAAGAPSPR